LFYHIKELIFIGNFFNVFLTPKHFRLLCAAKVLKIIYFLKEKPLKKAACVKKAAFFSGFCLEFGVWSLEQFYA
jgi:hypothetical protein